MKNPFQSTLDRLSGYKILSQSKAYQKDKVSKKDLLSNCLSWAFAAANQIANDEAKSQFYFYKNVDGKKERVDIEELPEEAQTFFTKPNPLQTFNSFVKQQSLQKSLTGESYIQWLENDDSVKRGIKLLDPSTIKNEKLDSQGKFVGWEVEGRSTYQEYYKREEIITDFLIHPTEVFRGLSPLEAFYPTLKLEKFAKHFLSDLFEKRAVPDILLSTDMKLNETEQNLIMKMWSDTYGGKNSEVGLVGGGFKATVLGFNPNDLKVLELLAISKEEMVQGAFSVPISKLGGNVSNRSIVEQQDDNYNENVVTPRLTDREAWINCDLLPELGIEDIFFAYENIIKGDKEFLLTKAKTTFKCGAITVNEFREVNGKESLGDEGDVYFIPSNVTVTKTFIPQLEPTQEEVALREIMPKVLKAADEWQEVKVKEAYKRAKSSLRSFLKHQQKQSKQNDYEIVTYDTEGLKRFNLDIDDNRLQRLFDESLNDYWERICSNSVVDELAYEIAKRGLENGV